MAKNTLVISADMRPALEELGILRHALRQGNTMQKAVIHELQIFKDLTGVVYASSAVAAITEDWSGFEVKLTLKPTEKMRDAVETVLDLAAPIPFKKK